MVDATPTFRTTTELQADRSVSAVSCLHAFQKESEIRLECLRLALASFGMAGSAPDLRAWATNVDRVASHFADIVFDEPRGEAE